VNFSGAESAVVKAMAVFTVIILVVPLQSGHTVVLFVHSLYDVLLYHTCADCSSRLSRTQHSAGRRQRRQNLRLRSGQGLLQEQRVQKEIKCELTAFALLYYYKHRCCIPICNVFGRSWSLVAFWVKIPTPDGQTDGRARP